jgi:preprotein translocase SecE subunit
MSQLSNYIQETRAEFKHVNWPTRRQTIVFTVLVVVISGVIAYLLGFFDYLFVKVLGTLLTR